MTPQAGWDQVLAAAAPGYKLRRSWPLLVARNSTEASAPSWEAALWPLPAPNTHPITLDAHVSFEAREAVFTLQGNQREPQSGGENPHPARPPHGQCWVGTLSSPTRPSGDVSLLTLCLLRFWPACSKKAAALEAWLHCAPPGPAL